MLTDFIKYKAIKKYILFFLIAIFIITLIPTVYISQYAQPSADDYAYGRISHNAYVETGSIFKAFGAAIELAKGSYLSWQGTISGIIVMTMAPYAFNMSLYFLTTPILLSLLICSILFFTYKAMVSYFTLDKTSWLIVSIVLLMASIEFLPYPTSSFFWYNGSSLYTTFFSLSLVIYALIISLIMKKKKLWPLYLILIPLTLFTGMGNFVSSLNLVIITGIWFLYMIIRKKKYYKRLIPIFIVALIALMIIALAPGNTIRQSDFESPSAISAIIKSFEAGFLYIFKSQAFVINKSYSILALIFVTPFMSKIITNPKYTFKKPWIVTLISYCVLSSLFTPVLYALHRTTLPRIDNIIYFSFLILVLINIVYIAGAIYNYIKRNNMPLLVSLQKSKKELQLVFYALLLIAFISTTLNVDFSANNQLPTSVRAFKVIRNDTGATYKREYDKRQELYESDTDNIIVKKYTYHPDLLFYEDMDADPDTWPNYIVAAFYKKGSIVVEE